MNRLGQIWVETAIYTLIAFVLIGAVLAFAKPKIDEMRDRAVIEQSINMLKEIDDKIIYLGIPGNQRTVTVGVKEGSLKIDGINDAIIFELESPYGYSEEGIEISEDNLKIITLRERGITKIRITANYSSTLNLTFDGEEKVKTITKSPTPYTVIIYKGELENELSRRYLVNLKIN